MQRIIVLVINHRQRLYLYQLCSRWNRKENVADELMAFHKKFAKQISLHDFTRIITVIEQVQANGYLNPRMH